MRQPSFFDRQATDGEPDLKGVVLYALGEFQARGKALADRDLPLDRLRGALRRAADSFGVEELGDERAAALFGELGAQVRRVPSFFAKHPFRVTVPAPLAARARDFYEERSGRQKAEADS